MTLQLAFPATMPPADDRLFGPDTFPVGWLVLALAALALAIGGLAWCFWPARPPRIVSRGADVLGLRERYLHHVDDLERQAGTDGLTPRALHHELSRTLRRFAVDLGTAHATSMSAGALDGAGQRAVASAVRRYENPQFEMNPASDPRLALSIARDVITNAEVES